MDRGMQPVIQLLLVVLDLSRGSVEQMLEDQKRLLHWRSLPKVPCGIFLRHAIQVHLVEQPAHKPIKHETSGEAPHLPQTAIGRWPHDECNLVPVVRSCLCRTVPPPAIRQPWCCGLQVHVQDTRLKLEVDHPVQHMHGHVPASANGVQSRANVVVEANNDIMAVYIRAMIFHRWAPTNDRNRAALAHQLLQYIDAGQVLPELFRGQITLRKCVGRVIKCLEQLSVLICPRFAE
mmetsp:Transcript_12881/g.29151  ORF Transcript_12881/g.29151 Transcript_12881/m.29151 type:complete len:234 (-) Transcript_12881:575-1276(-)